MLAGDKPLTLGARAADPYLHLDNRGLVVFDGYRCLMFPANTLPWVRETLELLLDEKRATRRQGDHYLGGFVAEDGSAATVYAGPVDDLATLRIDVDALTELRDKLRS